MTDIIIIGAGPAGLTAALYAQRAGHTVLVFEGDLPGGQAVTTPHVENWPGTLKVTGPDFASNLVEQATHFNIPIKYESVIELMEIGEHKIIKTKKQQYECRAVILATGLQRRKLMVPGEERLAGRGVSYCALCDGNFFRGKDVAVIGGGNTAIEDALYLSSICNSVSLIHKNDTFRAEPYLVDQIKLFPNIHTLMNCTVIDIKGDEQVESLALKAPTTTTKIEVHGIFIAIGFLPENSMFSPPLQLDEAGFIIAKDDCTTSIPGIFVAGDCRTKEFRQLITASADGVIAVSKAGQYLIGHY